MPNVVEDLRLLIRTRHAIVTIRTLDESFAARAIRKAGHEMRMPVLEWTLSEGIRRVEPPGEGAVGGTKSLDGALGFMRGNNAFNIYILKDALPHLKDPSPQRLLREIAMSYSQDRRTVFMIDPEGKLPVPIRPLAVPYDLALPDEKEILQLVKKTLKELTELGRPKIEMTRDEQDKFLANLRGLTRMEISQVVASAILGDGKLTGEDIAHTIDLKRQRFQQTGVLDYIPPPDGDLEVGGMKKLRGWLERRTRAFSPKAREYGLEPPRGILMLGVQGCGKSLMARVVAADTSRCCEWTSGRSTTST